MGSSPILISFWLAFSANCNLWGLWHTQYSHHTFRRSHPVFPTPTLMALSQISSTLCECCAQGLHLMANYLRFHARRNQAHQETVAIHNSAQQFARNAHYQVASALNSDSSLEWNTDTGATSHMTPYCHFPCDYKPHRVPIYFQDLHSHSPSSCGIRCLNWLCCSLVDLLQCSVECLSPLDWLFDSLWF